MNNVSSRERRVNNILVLAIFVVTALSMALAAGLGIFSASSEEATQSADLIEAAVDEASQTPTELAATSRSSVVEPVPSEEELSEEQAAHVVSELKLQEVRDTYLQFGETIDGVSVHYESAQLCRTAVVCVDPQNADRILVNKVWAANAELQNIKVKLAQAHADLVIERVWHSTDSAQQFLNQILPACEILDDSHLKQAAGIVLDPTITGANASVAGFKDVIVAQLVPEYDDLLVYPRSLHTDVQITAAHQVARGEEPEVVIPVSALNCSNF